MSFSQLYNQYLHIPKLQPFRFVKRQYADEFFFKDEIPSVEKQQTYNQIWEALDPMTFQLKIKYTFLSRIIRPEFTLIDCQQNVMATFKFNSLYTDSDGWTYVHIYKTLQYYNSAIFPDGTYYIKLNFRLADDETQDIYYSEPIDIKQTHENSVLLEYRHETNDFDMIFQKRLIDLKTQIEAGEINPYDVIATVPLYQMRVKGGFYAKGFAPASVDEIYADITHDQTILSSVPFNTKTLTIGDNAGVPNWQIDKVNRVLSCTFLRINDEYYTKADGATLEQVAYTDRNVKGAWAINLTDFDNKYGKTYRPLQMKKGIGKVIIGNGFVITDSAGPVPVFTPDILIKEIYLVAPYSSGAEKAQFTVIAGSGARVTSITATVTAVTKVNDVVKTVPFIVAVGDVVKHEFAEAATEGQIIMYGEIL
jgi:hypothetical protein